MFHYPTTECVVFAIAKTSPLRVYCTRQTELKHKYLPFELKTHFPQKYYYIALSDLK